MMDNKGETNADKRIQLIMYAMGLFLFFGIHNLLQEVSQYRINGD